MVGVTVERVSQMQRRERVLVNLCHLTAAMPEFGIRQHCFAGRNPTPEAIAESRSRRNVILEEIPKDYQGEACNKSRLLCRLTLHYIDNKISVNNSNPN
ncbi:hypothetical protein Bca101_055461 [Brassica carinata]